MPKLLVGALAALVLLSTTAEAARNDRILLILPDAGDWRDEVIAFWNDGVGLEVDMVVDPALGTQAATAEEGMTAAFDAADPGVEWTLVRVSEPGELAGRVAELTDADTRLAAIGPYEAFSDNPSEAYTHLEGVIVTTPALPDDGDRAAFLSRMRVVATQVNEARPGTLIGISLEPAATDTDPLLPTHKLFEDTRDFVGIFAIDVAAHGMDGVALVESVATASPPRARGMYVDMMQRPENILDPAKEIWMQRGAMVLGVLTIIGVFLIVRWFKAPQDDPPKSAG